MQFNIDNSKLTDFAECDARAIARHVFGLQGKGDKIAADIGNAYHAALPLHFQGQAKQAIMQTFEVEYNKVIPPGQEPEEARFERSNCRKIMDRYCDVRTVAEFPFTVFAFEETKGVKLAEDEQGEIIFWVKRDMLGQDRQTNAIVPIDHKTTGKLSDWWARKFRLASQLSGYCSFTAQEYQQPVLQAYVNAIEVSKLPDSTRKCATHKKMYQECGHLHANFQLYRYTRSPQQLEKWKADAIALAKRARTLTQGFSDINLLKYATRQGSFNEGCVFCDLKEWCLADFEPKVAMEYCVHDPWEPWRSGVRIDL